METLRSHTSSDSQAATRTTDRAAVAPEAASSAPPLLMTTGEVAVLLRTTRKAVYAMVDRQQLPGVTRVGRRVLIRSDQLLHWLRQKSAPSLER